MHAKLERINNLQLIWLIDELHLLHTYLLSLIDEPDKYELNINAQIKSLKQLLAKKTNPVIVKQLLDDTVQSALLKLINEIFFNLPNSYEDHLDSLAGTNISRDDLIESFNKVYARKNLVELDEAREEKIIRKLDLRLQTHMKYIQGTYTQIRAMIQTESKRKSLRRYF